MRVASSCVCARVRVYMCVTAAGVPSVAEASSSRPAPAIALLRLVSPHASACVSRSAAAHLYPAEDLAA
jgi:hypothetical protein